MWCFDISQCSSVFSSFQPHKSTSQANKQPPLCLLIMPTSLNNRQAISQAVSQPSSAVSHWTECDTVTSTVTLMQTSVKLNPHVMWSLKAKNGLFRVNEVVGVSIDMPKERIENFHHMPSSSRRPEIRMLP